LSRYRRADVGPASFQRDIPRSVLPHRRIGEVNAFGLTFKKVDALSKGKVAGSEKNFPIFFSLTKRYERRQALVE
jgi:hypothetical protein